MDRCHYDKILKLCKGKPMAEVAILTSNLGLTAREWLELRKCCRKRKGLYNLKSRCLTQACLAASSINDWIAIAEVSDNSHYRFRALQQIARYSFTGVTEILALRNSKLPTLSFLGWCLLGAPDDSRPALSQIIRI